VPSVAITVNLVVPTTVGVPEKIPSGRNVIPAGRLPKELNVASRPSWVLNRAPKTSLTFAVRMSVVM